MHQLFDEVIGTPPPATVDLPALVRRDRRTRRARLAGLGVTGVAAAGLAVALLADGTTPAGTPPVARPPGPVAADNRFVLKSDTQLDAETSAKQLAAAIDTAVRKAVPDATWQQGPAVTVMDNADRKGWHGHGSLRTPTTRGDLTIMALSLPEPGAKTDKPPLRVSCDGEAGCTPGTTADGKPIVTIAGTSGAARWLEVRVGLPANRLLTISVTNVGTGDPTVLSGDQVALVAQHTAGQIK
jgi:hypothetical protein